ncbi:MAG: TIGR04211 family SH3 domain-containing protein [Arenicella sp.]
MKKIIILSVCLILGAAKTAFSATQYITDEFDIMLRVAPSIGAKIIKPLPTGTPLTVIITNAGKAHSQVRTKDGLVGYVLTRFISRNEPAKLRVVQLEKRLKSLEENPEKLESKYLDLQKSYERLSQNLRSMVDSKEQAEEKYAKLKLDSGNAAALSEEATELGKKVEQLVLQLDDMRIQNETLKDHSEKKSWIVGGVIALFGVLFGAILTGLNARKKRNW